MKSIFLIVSLFVVQLIAVSASFAAANAVDVKCEIFYRGPDGPSGARTSIDKFVETMKLTSVQVGLSTNFKFDQIHSFAKMGRPNLKVWIKGNYFRNENQVNAYLRFSTYLCESGGTPAGLECFDSAYSGDVFANKVIQNTIYRGKNIQTYSNDMQAKNAASGSELEFKYRLKTGHSMEDDTDFTDATARKKYYDVVLPIAAVRCSVRDDGFGVEGIF